MSEEQKVATVGNFIDALDSFGDSLETVQQLLVWLNANPASIDLIKKLFPNAAVLVDVLQTLGPWIDFLQQLEEKIKAILNQ